MPIKPFFLLLMLSISLLFSAFGFAAPLSDMPTMAQEAGDEDLDDFFTDPVNTDPDDTDSSGDVDDFFSDEPPQATESESPALTESVKPDFPLDITGSLALKSGFRFSHDAPDTGQPDHRGLSKAAAELFLELRHSFSDHWNLVISGKASHDTVYAINGRNQYPGEFLDDNETRLEWDEAYLRGTLSQNLDIKLGRQIVVWGKSDNIRVTDILNPLDLREPGLTDIEDLRRPVFMTRVDYYLSNITFTGYLLHERRSHFLPVSGSPYYFFPIALPDPSDPSGDIEHTEYALSVSATFEGMDIAFYLADVYDNSPILIQNRQRIHERIQMVGLAANKASGNFLFKGEAAFFDKIRLSGTPSGPAIIENQNDYSRLDTLAGIEYTGFENTTLSFEISDRWLTNHDAQAVVSGLEDHTIQYALRGNRTFLNEVLEMTLLASFYGESADDGGFVRAQGTYDLTDDMAFTLGFIVYQSGSVPFLKEIGENDALFMNLVYSF